MVDTYRGPFGAYTNVTPVIVPATQTILQAQIAKLKALIPDNSQAVSAAHPEFDAITPALAERLRTEVDGLAAAIAAAPTA